MNDRTEGNAVFAFEVSVKGTEWMQTINARSSGKAKRQYHLSVSEAWPGIPYTAMRCRKIGAPTTSRQFECNAAYRGLLHVRCGQRVTVNNGGRGVIVGHNASANFDVLFDEDSPRYPGMTLNVHPGEITLDGQSPEYRSAVGV